jgi:DNA (cytosine-5)-methyltransferase 1
MESARAQLRTFYEFFAGGGMARAGLGEEWRCLFANDFDEKKAASYAANWGSEHLVVEDVAKLRVAALPGEADMAWASFPCQDLSLAGDGAGLKGKRSGSFWPFWRLVEKLVKEGRPPSVVVLENVCGALTSHGGADFAAICTALTKSGYRFGAMVLDAVHFVPQSRPRLFIVALRMDYTTPTRFIGAGPESPWHTQGVFGAFQKLPQKCKANWIWWNLPEAPTRTTALEDVIDKIPQGARWHTGAETKRILGMMSDLHLKKVATALRAHRRTVGCIYKRMRIDERGDRVQRAEVRFDGISGCLRTPVGGSSRQIVIEVERNQINTRLLSPREAARLMGLPESYTLPERYNDAYHLAGDGVAVPVVRFLAQHLLEPLLNSVEAQKKEAA